MNECYAHCLCSVNIKCRILENHADLFTDFVFRLILLPLSLLHLFVCSEVAIKVLFQHICIKLQNNTLQR